jgi:trigger factor
MAFQVTVKPLPQSEVEMTISVEWSEWSKELPHAVEHLSEHIKIAGFRKGKVPQALLEKKIGKQALLDEAAEHVIQKVYGKILAQEKIDAIGRPKAEIVRAADGESLVFTAVTAIAPVLKLGEWKQLVTKINEAFVKNTVVIDEDTLNKEIQRLAESRAKLITVNRAAKNGDTAVVDFEVLRDGVRIEGGLGKQHPLVLGSGAFIPGFEEQVVGMQAGEEKSFELTFPEKYHAKHLAGNPATFKVKLTAVQEKDVPMIDDAFAQSLGKFTTLAELQQNFREGMLEEKKQQANEERRASILDVLVEASTVELPKVLTDEELVRMLREFEYQIQNMGMELEAYLTGLNKTKEDLFKEWEPQAKKRVTAALALAEVAKEQEIEPAQEEVESEMNKTLQYFRSINKAEKDVDMTMLFHHAKERLQNEKVFDFLEAL